MLRDGRAVTGEEDGLWGALMKALNVRPALGVWGVCSYGGHV